MKMPAMTPRLRKLTLTAHITFSVGWLGAVAAFLVLSIAGLTSQDAEVVRGSYLAMNLIGLFVIVPMSLVALATGLTQSLGTEWGLLRHYWVLVKFLLTIFATLVLLVKIPMICYVARRAEETTLPLADLHAAGIQLMVHAAGGLLVLLVITILSVFKPWGRTHYGRHKPQQERHESVSSTSPVAMANLESAQTLGGSPMSTPPPTIPNPDKEATAKGLPLGLKIFLAAIVVVVVGFAVLHLTGVHHH